MSNAPHSSGNGELTRQEPLLGAIDAYKEFDKRSPGWVKVELQPQTH